MLTRNPGKVSHTQHHAFLSFEVSHDKNDEQHWRERFSLARTRDTPLIPTWNVIRSELTRSKCIHAFCYSRVQCSLLNLPIRCSHSEGVVKPSFS